MARYIDAEKLDNDGWSASRTYPQDAHTMVYETKKMTDFPAADVVPVVRCKDCRWFDLTDPCGTLTPNAHRCKRVTRLWMEDDTFCAYGERREE